MDNTSGLMMRERERVSPSLSFATASTMLVANSETTIDQKIVGKTTNLLMWLCGTLRIREKREILHPTAKVPKQVVQDGAFLFRGTMIQRLELSSSIK